MGVYPVIVGKWASIRSGAFVDELDTVCREVPLEYGFKVFMWCEQDTVCFHVYLRYPHFRTQ
jgi:hypothetical protein